MLRTNAKSTWDLEVNSSSYIERSKVQLDHTKVPDQWRTNEGEMHWPLSSFGGLFIQKVKTTWCKQNIVIKPGFLVMLGQFLVVLCRSRMVSGRSCHQNDTAVYIWCPLHPTTPVDDQCSLERSRAVYSSALARHAWLCKSRLLLGSNCFCCVMVNTLHTSHACLDG
jgi:hypothetical protein